VRRRAAPFAPIAHGRSAGVSHFRLFGAALLRQAGASFWRDRTIARAPMSATLSARGEGAKMIHWFSKSGATFKKKRPADDGVDRSSPAPTA
jgi:hypothetical protein